MALQESIIHSHIPARQVRSLQGFDAAQYNSLKKIGIHLDNSVTRPLQTMANRYYSKMHGMDALQPAITTPSIGTPVQFLQTWLPGFVKINTYARKIDELAGIMTAGAWEDEQVVFGVIERKGVAQPYGDYTNVPEASWNVNFIQRTVVQFELGMRVGVKEAARSSRMQVDDAGMKRDAASLVLEIARNLTGFVGFNSGANLTYGFLNDPDLSAYVTVANGVSGSPLWPPKTFDEIVKDLSTAFVALRTQSGDTIDPASVNLTLALPSNCVDWLAKPSTQYGKTVRSWLTENYPRTRVVSSPNLNSANGGANVFYLYADQVDDSSTDGGASLIQPVPAKFLVLGVQQLAKGYLEDYSNATAGCIWKRPYAIVRYTGI